MPLVPVANVAALDVIWIQANQPVENTFHYQFAAPPTEAELRAIQDTYSSWAGAHSSLFSNNCQLVKMQSRDLTSSGGLSVEGNVIPPVAGTNASGQMPNNVTWALKRQTGFQGRAMRGRIFIIGIAHNMLDAGFQEIEPASAASLVAAYDTLMNSQFTDNGADEVIVHKALGTKTHVTGYAFSDLFLDSQRRRLPGHNRHH